MTDVSEFADARAHLEQALRVLDRLGLHLAAADVSSALDRMQRSAVSTHPSEDEIRSTGSD
jgi:hypothetical protein